MSLIIQKWFDRDLSPPAAGGGGGTTAPVGASNETDASLSLSRIKSKVVGLSVETDSALALTLRKARSVGLASETDAAFALSRTKSKAVGLSAETDTALALSAGSSLNAPVGRADEADTAFSLSRVKSKSVGMSAETDSALAVSRVKSRSIGLASETDSALAMSRQKIRACGTAIEADTAFALGVGGILSAPVGVAIEVDTAFALTAASTGGGQRNSGGPDPRRKWEYEWELLTARMILARQTKAAAPPIEGVMPVALEVAPEVLPQSVPIAQVERDYSLFAKLVAAYSEPPAGLAPNVRQAYIEARSRANRAAYEQLLQELEAQREQEDEQFMFLAIEALRHWY